MCKKRVHKPGAHQRVGIPIAACISADGSTGTVLNGLPAGYEGFDVVGLGRDGAWTSCMTCASPLDYPNSYEVVQNPATRPNKIFARIPEDLADVAPDHLHYPIALNNLVLKDDAAYLSGVCYEYEWSGATRSLQKACALRTATHPGLQPDPGPEGYPMELHVPGQMQLTPGIPVRVKSGDVPIQSISLTRSSVLGRMLMWWVRRGGRALLRGAWHERTREHVGLEALCLVLSQNGHQYGTPNRSMRRHTHYACGRQLTA